MLWNMLLVRGLGLIPIREHFQEKDDHTSAAFEILRVSAVQLPSDRCFCRDLITFVRFEIDSLVQTLQVATETSISNFALDSRATRRQGSLCSALCEHKKLGLWMYCMAIAYDLCRSIWHESDVKTMVRVFVMASIVRRESANNFSTYR